MELQRVNIEDLQPHPMNYNTHPESQIIELEKSLDDFSQFKNIVVCNNVILIGHGVVEAAKRKGMSEIYALVRNDLTEDQQKALLIADNAIPFLAIPDTGLLEDLLEGMPDINKIPGINEEWLKAMSIFDVIDFDGNDNFGSSPWDRIGEKDSKTTLFKFGEIVCNIDNSIYERFLAYLDGKNIKEIISSMLSI